LVTEASVALLTIGAVGFAEILSSAALLISAGTLIVAIRRFDHERQMEDRKDARSTLADGALELGRMKAVMKDSLTKFEKPLTGKAEWPSDSIDQIHKLELAAEELEGALAAVRIRFQHEENVVARLESAYDSARSVITVYGLAYGTEPDEDHQDYAEAVKFGTIFDSQKDAYLIAAQGAVGVKLA
jgi:hypothetical protein